MAVILTLHSSIVGPMIGGALAKPVETLPWLFSPGSVWERFPYLLPNLFSAVCVMVGVVIGILFLEETHAEKKRERDRGVELGKLLLSYLPSRNRSNRDVKNGEERPLLSDTDEFLPGYLTNESPSSSASTSTDSVQDLIDVEEGADGQLARPESKPAGKIFTKPIITIIASYGILAL